MLAVLCAALLAAASSNDTVVTRDGGRVVGTVIEENPTTGVTIQTPDGQVRQYTRDQVDRIEFADGTVSRMEPAPRAPVPPPAAAAPQPAPQPAPQAQNGSNEGDSRSGKLDTIYFQGGGRARGTVLEDSPREGVSVRLIDGTIRHYSRREISRIEYADGTVARWRTPPETTRRSAPPPAYAPPPTYAPPPSAPPPYTPEPAYVQRGPRSMEPLPLWAAVGVGATFFGGDAERDFTMRDTFNPQAHIGLEGGVRLSPAFGLGLYMDIGGGDPAAPVRDQCRATGLTDCVATAGRIGFLLRHTWEPASTAAKWVTLGTGWEFGSVSADNGMNSNEEVFTYKGREYLRLGAGVDFRQNPVLGVGLYGSVAFGEYDRIETPTANSSVQGDLHTTVQVGVRLTLFP
jgi:hypothetical protein